MREILAFGLAVIFTDARLRTRRESRVEWVTARMGREGKRIDRGDDSNPTKHGVSFSRQEAHQVESSFSTYGSPITVWSQVPMTEHPEMGSEGEGMHRVSVASSYEAHLFFLLFRCGRLCAALFLD